MKILKLLNFIRTIGLTAACLILLAASGLLTNGQMTPMPTPKTADKSPAKSQDKVPDKTMDKPDDMDAMDEEIPHAFFTHEGLPDEVGTFALRTSAVALRIDGQTKGDFGFHLETGLAKRIGLHVRNDRFLNNTRTEFMFQFAAVKSKNGKNGFAPILEFEIPTRRGGGSRVNVLFGFSTKFSNSKAAFNSVVHYDPREKMVESNMSFVFKAAKRLYPVFEVLAEAGEGMSPIVSLVGGFKVRMTKNWLIGFGFQAPTTHNKDFSSEGIFQSDNMFMRKR